MEIDLHLAEDRSRAVLVLPARRALTPEHLRQLIARAGIRFGLQRQALVAATESAAHDRELILAEGTPPEPPTAAQLMLDSPDLPRVVAAGAHIGVLRPAQPGKPGIGIDGVAIAPPASPASNPLGRGLIAHGEKVLAARSGTLHAVAGIFQVRLDAVEERLRDTIVIQSDARGMEAWIRLEAGEYLSGDLLPRELAAARITHHLDAEAIAAATCGSAEARTLVLAHGLPVVHGSDGSVEHCIDMSRQLIEDEHGNVDFRQGQLIEVEPGRPLVRLIAATPGTPGETIRGQAIPAKPGREVDPGRFLGSGTRQNPSDPRLIEAAIAGIFVRSRGDSVAVSPEVKIAGDCDMHVGNLITRFPIKITGDVKKDFVLKSGGDIQIGGSVEDARISARGDLSVREGILPGQHRVKAFGRLTARHISGRTVKAGAVQISGGISGAHVLATGDVTAREIQSSEVTAAGNVLCDTLGDPTEQRVSIRVGVDPFRETRYRAALDEHDRIIAASATHKDRCKALAHQVQVEHRKARLQGRPPDREPEERLRAELAAFEEACRRLTACETAIADHEAASAELAARAGAATITVKGTVYPGAELAIGTARPFCVRDLLSHVTFRHSDGRVVLG